jgi:polynucleotide 5'-hydroxyl-kinase GRC3/NOL9
MESISEAQEGSNQISSAVPLVINTQGWVKGLGADLLLKIEALVEPTHVITLGVDSQPINIDETISRYFLDGISPAIPPPSHTAADLRALSIISYFYSATSPSNPESTLWDTSLPLCSQPPWEVDWTIALKKVILLGPGAEDVFPEEVENSLNCGLVALIESDDDFGDDLIPTATAVPYKQGQRVPPPTSSRCLGLGLIRAINREAHVFHLLTPIRSSLLGRCNALVKGELEIPTWCMMDFRQDDDSVCGLKGAAVPYLHWGAQVGVGADKRRVRRNLMRRGQM